MAYVAGTEQFSQGNQINVDTKQFGVTGDYFWKDVKFSAGYEREQSDFINIFHQLRCVRVYRDLSPLLSNDVFHRRYQGGASDASDGQIKPTYNSEPADFNIDNVVSRKCFTFVPDSYNPLVRRKVGPDRHAH